MTSLEWKRDATERLIEVYRKHPVLYNMRHPKYYNKNCRNEALESIIDALQDIRPETTGQDVLRKIQTLRTQFGQEVSKIRRSSKGGTTYIPSAWWYKGLSFLQNHIKPRSTSPVPTPGKSEPAWKEENTYNVSIVTNGSAGDSEYEQYEQTEDIEYGQIHYEINPIEASKNSTKSLEIKPVLSTSGNLGPPLKIRKLNNSTIDIDQTTQETIVSEVTLETERHKSLGTFVASQLSNIKDDYLFYETQMEVLNLVNRAIIKQLTLDRNESSNE